MSKGHSTKGQKIPFISDLKSPTCASKQDVLDSRFCGTYSKLGMGNDNGSVLLYMAVCFDFRSTKIVQLIIISRRTKIKLAAFYKKVTVENSLFRGTQSYNCPFFISHYLYRRQPNEFIFSQKNLQMKAGQNNKCDITKLEVLCRFE